MCSHAHIHTQAECASLRAPSAPSVVHTMCRYVQTMPATEMCRLTRMPARRARDLCRILYVYTSTTQKSYNTRATTAAARTYREFDVASPRARRVPRLLLQRNENHVVAIPTTAPRLLRGRIAGRELWVRAALSCLVPMGLQPRLCTRPCPRSPPAPPLAPRNTRVIAH